jgi:2-haloacid dehalogenase
VSERRRPAIGAVVFDVGGVLVDWDPRHLYRKLFDDSAAMERFLTSVCSPQWHAPHDRGQSTAESCGRLAEVYPEYADEIWAWMWRSEEMVAGAIDGTVDIVAELTGAGVSCYVLSNMEAETFPRRRARFEFFGWFDGIVVSGLEGVAKPDPEIFRRLLDRFALHPETTLFIDDKVENLESAASLGMRTVWFKSPDGLRRSLHAARLPVAGPAEGQNG